LGKSRKNGCKNSIFFEQSFFWVQGAKSFFLNKSLKGVDKADKFSAARWSWGFAQIAIERECEIISWGKTKDNGEV